MRSFLRIAVLGLCLTGAAAQASAQGATEVTLDVPADEAWWGGAVTLGTNMPYGTAPLAIDLHANNRGNQYAPLLVSSKGRFVWCDKAFAFAFSNGTLRVSARGPISHGKPGSTLRDAFRHASRTFFPADGKMPDRGLFASPQYNTWIELMYDQNQKDVLAYAHAILDNGFPPGVLMIDDNWQEDYGKWDFHPGRFSDPKAMMKELHAMGFRVMLWVCPFVSPDCDVYRALAAKKAFFMEKPGDPAMVPWWNGKSAMLDLSNPVASEWFKGQLARLRDVYGVDGYKLDAGDSTYYKESYLAHRPLDANEHAALFGEIGLDFPLNEYRAVWKLAGRPLAQRLRDKSHSWGDLRRLIPDAVAAGMLGYAFVCPDLIGGGEFTSFLPGAKMDPDLIVRSAQVHALMPMMQFSVAPWRVLDRAHLDAVKKAVAVRMALTPRILKLAESAAASGEPILRPMEYVFPGCGYAALQDQFMMGDDLLVAPMVEKGSSRKVRIPCGRWKADDGTVIEGPAEPDVAVPLDRLPYFERI